MVCTLPVPLDISDDVPGGFFAPQQFSSAAFMPQSVDYVTFLRPTYRQSSDAEILNPLPLTERQRVVLEEPEPRRPQFAIAGRRAARKYDKIS